jgi:hypothetical protein
LDIESGSRRGWDAEFRIFKDVDHAHGIERLSYENVLTPETGALMFIPGGGLTTLGPEIPSAEVVRERIEMFTSQALPTTVTETVWRMFEFAKGAMCYGLWFYPLFTLGDDHLSRLFEWMVRDRYEALSKKKGVNLEAMVDWLIKHKDFPDDMAVRWRAMYRMRNLVSHPEIQHLTDPHAALRHLHAMRNLVVHFYVDGSTGSAVAESV